MASKHVAVDTQLHLKVQYLLVTQPDNVWSYHCTLRPTSQMARRRDTGTMSTVAILELIHSLYLEERSKYFCWYQLSHIALHYKSQSDMK